MSKLATLLMTFKEKCVHLMLQVKEYKSACNLIRC